MNKDIKKLFSGISNALAKYDASVKSTLTTYKRDREQAAQTASKYKDTDGEFKRLKNGLVAKARAALEDADKQFADDVRLYYLPKLRESLADHLMERPDTAFTNTLRLYKDFGLKLSLAEITALLTGAQGNFTALRCLQAVTRDSGYSLKFPGVEDFQRDIETIEKLTWTPICYAPLELLSEIKEIWPQRPIHRADGSTAYQIESDTVFLIGKSQQFSSAWKNMEAVSSRWSAALVPSIESLEPVKDETTGAEISREEQHEKNIADAASQVDVDSNDAVVAAQKIGEQRAAEAAQSKSIIASYTG